MVRMYLEHILRTQLPKCFWIDPDTNVLRGEGGTFVLGQYLHKSSFDPYVNPLTGRVNGLSPLFGPKSYGDCSDEEWIRSRKYIPPENMDGWRVEEKREGGIFLRKNGFYALLIKSTLVGLGQGIDYAFSSFNDGCVRTQDGTLIARVNCDNPLSIPKVTYDPAMQK